MENDRYKIIIMTASVGSGHDQAANAIRNNILREYSNVDVEVVDFIELSSWSIGGIIKSTYLKMIEMVPSWYNLLYQMTMRLNQTSKVTSIFSYKYNKKLKGLINGWNPDMILFTNPVPSIIVSQLKRNKKIDTHTATIITDYAVHGVWLDNTIDNYFVGSNIIKSEMINRGIDGDKIYAMGIPIDDKFKELVNKEEALEKLGMNMKIPTVLIMGGGLGLGSVHEILDSTNNINRDLQIIVVAGKNEELKNELQNRKYRESHNVKILGFCDNVHELMSCSQLLISKSGGLTMTEAISKELPVLIFDPIPGQEIENAKYLSDIGVARYLKDASDIEGYIDELLFTDPLRREKMVKCCSMIKREDAASNISRIILRSIDKEVYNQVPMAK